MARPSRVWLRKGRGYWSVIAGHQRFLSHNLREAKLRLKELLSQTPSKHGEHPLSHLVGLYLADCVTRVKPRTLSRYRDYLERWVAYCDRERIAPADLRAYHLRAWLSSRRTWNPSTRNAAGRAVKMWSAFAESEGYLDGNRLRSASLPTPLKRAAADPEDLIRLERAITDDAFRDFYIILYDTGARPGEIAGLTAARVDFTTSTAIVDGKRGERIIGLTPRALEIARRCALVRPEGPLLVNANGEPWTQARQQWAFKKWEKVAGCGHVVPYHLRHNLWQQWHRLGISDIVISRQLGHTLRGAPHLGLLASTYAHAAAADLAAAARLAAGQTSKSRKRG